MPKFVATIEVGIEVSALDLVNAKRLVQIYANKVLNNNASEDDYPFISDIWSQVLDIKEHLEINLASKA